MNILQIVGIGFAGLFCATLVKEFNKTYALIVSLITCVLILCMVVPYFDKAFVLFSSVTKSIGGTNFYLEEIAKIIGIAYISDISSALCNDAGESAIGLKIELAGKVSILIVGLPIILDLLELLSEIRYGV